LCIYLFFNFEIQNIMTDDHRIIYKRKENDKIQLKETKNPRVLFICIIHIYSFWFVYISFTSQAIN